MNILAYEFFRACFTWELIDSELPDNVHVQGFPLVNHMAAGQQVFLFAWHSYHKWKSEWAFACVYLPPTLSYAFFLCKEDKRCWDPGH